MSYGKSVLIIEDDRDIANLVAINLKDLGLTSEFAADGVSGLKKAQTGSFSLIILDLMLPELDGLEVCRGIRKLHPTVPVLMLTAKSEELDKVLGLELGADDYVTKPFGIRELMARIKALLRRSDGESSRGTELTHEVVSLGGLVVDFAKRRVTSNAQVVDLTAKEFDLLSLFVRNPGRAFSRSQLLELVWGYQFDGYDHTVNSHINRLRNKIERDPGQPLYLQTVWGVGYRFTDLEDLEARESNGAGKSGQ